MIKRTSVYFVFLFLLCYSVAYAQPKSKKVILHSDYQKHFDRYEVGGSIVIEDLKNHKSFYYDEARTKKQFSPASTFKIFNSLVGLETGVIPDTSFVIPWDSVQRGKYAPWHRSNSLNSAFKFSVVWYYQELARRVGNGEMQRLISLNKYGNEDIRESIDGFWLTDMNGKLRISQVEQIEFLKKLYGNELKFSARSQQLTKSIMLMETTGNYRLFAKTGMCSENNLWYGWYVGWIETNENVYFFATHVESEDNQKILAGARKGVTFAMLEELGIIEKPK